MFGRQASFTSLATGAALLALPALAEPSAAVVTVRNDPGGQVIEYALKAKKLERARKVLRFAGRCDSACTLYLMLPKARMCATPEASFGFHLPYGSSESGNRIAAEYMLRNYPAWVKSWLRANGGLTRQIKTMDYRSIRRHVPACAGDRVASL